MPRAPSGSITRDPGPIALAPVIVCIAGEGAGCPPRPATGDDVIEDHREQDAPSNFARKVASRSLRLTPITPPRDFAKTSPLTALAFPRKRHVTALAFPGRSCRLALRRRFDLRGQEDSARIPLRPRRDLDEAAPPS